MLVSDEKHLRSIKWQYMVLDEAQAIKSSQRYETLSSILLFIRIPIDIYKKLHNLYIDSVTIDIDVLTCLHQLFIMFCRGNGAEKLWSNLVVYFNYYKNGHNF